MSSGVMRIGSKGLMATLVITDAAGNPALPVAPPAWSSSDTTIATVTAAQDGMSAIIAPAGKVGVATINVVVEGDPTPGVDTIHGSGDVNVVAGEAAAVALNFTPVV